jgi:flagellar basal body-associated protein FliL
MSPAAGVRMSSLLVLLLVVVVMMVGMETTVCFRFSSSSTSTEGWRITDVGKLFWAWTRTFIFGRKKNIFVSIKMYFDDN